MELQVNIVMAMKFNYSTHDEVSLETKHIWVADWNHSIIKMRLAMFSKHLYMEPFLSITLCHEPQEQCIIIPLFQCPV